MKTSELTKFNRVMLVDDCRLDRYILSRMIELHDIGKEIIEFHNPLNALTYLEDNRHDQQMWPELIFIDVVMPQLDGFSFIRAINKFPKTRVNKLKLVMLTSSIDSNNILHASGIKNISGFWGKPITTEMLARL